MKSSGAAGVGGVGTGSLVTTTGVVGRGVGPEFSFHAMAPPIRRTAAAAAMPIGAFDFFPGRGVITVGE